MARWEKLSSRGTVVDRRSSRVAYGAGGLGIAGVAVLLLIQVLSGDSLDVGDVLQQLQTTPVQTQTIDTAAFEGADTYEVFASTVLGSTTDLWSNVFATRNQAYEPPTLVLFRTATESGCGGASSDVGPHYCPVDKTIYLDETFFDTLRDLLGGNNGDVAQAYVIAHEVGHHVQQELGIMDEVQSNNNQRTSIDLELQADCFAGVWAYSIKDRGIFEPNEIQEALDAAAAVGDDRVQRKVRGQINPETWTHGSSAERVRWFNRGYEQGTVASCNTFK